MHWVIQVYWINYLFYCTIIGIFIRFVCMLTARPSKDLWEQNSTWNFPHGSLCYDYTIVYLIVLHGGSQGENPIGKVLVYQIIIMHQFIELAVSNTECM